MMLISLSALAALEHPHSRPNYSSVFSTKPDLKSTNGITFFDPLYAVWNSLDVGACKLEYSRLYDFPGVELAMARHC